MLFGASLRRVENKLDAKGIESEPVLLRCEDPPATKRVQLNFPAWVVYQQGVASNVWMGCQMMQDKSFWYLLKSFFWRSHECLKLVVGPVF